jgi:hypothetical protein
MNNVKFKKLVHSKKPKDQLRALLWFLSWFGR